MKPQAFTHRRTDKFFLLIRQDVFMTTIGHRIKALRTSRHLTQVQLAGLLGIKQNTLSDMERDKTSDMTAVTLESVCRVLVTTPRYVLYGLDSAYTHESAMQEAELVALFRELPAQAQTALVNSARLLREAIPTNSPAQPIIGAVKPTRVKAR